MTTQFNSTSSYQEFVEERDEFFQEESFSGTARNSLGALLWWIISVTVHAMLALLAFYIIIGAYEEKEEIDLLEVSVAEAPVEKEEEKKEEVKLEKKTEVKVEAETDVPFFTPEKIDVVEDPTEVETENEIVSEHKSKGHQDAISTIPAEGTGSIGFFGVGGGGRAGAFGWRSGGGRKRSALKNGGSKGSEASVDIGLEWLSKHQEPNGFWDAMKYEGGTHADSTGCTGLAMLAFLGAGHTAKHGIYKDTVKRAQDFLLDLESGKKDGILAINSRCGYDHAMCGIALAEAYGMTKDSKLKSISQRAVDYSANVHQDNNGGEYSAWRYRAGEAPDTSVAGWFIMQLKSAKVAGLTVPGSAFMGAENWLNEVQPLPKNGDVYEGIGMGRYVVDRDPTPAMTAVCMLARLFMGYEPKHPVLQGGANYLAENLPDLTRSADLYYLYYGTLAMFQMGGDHWKKWNEVMRDPLIELQIKNPGDNLGSWGVETRWGSRGGRVYTTAMAVLSLEVYYRYLPMYH